MKMEDCFQLLREIKSLSFATVDEQGNPQVRIIDAMLVEDKKLYFLTARGKNFYQELMTHKKVAVVGLSKDYQMIRLNGDVEKLMDQKKWIDRMFEANPSMNDVYPNNSRSILEPFCIHLTQMEVFDLSKNPIYRQSFTVSVYPIQKKDF